MVEAKVGRELASWRAEFPILDTTVYLISNSLGAMPRGTRAYLSEYADQWSSRGIRAWEETWWDLPRQVGNLIGGILGCEPDQVSLHQNVTIGQWIVLSCLEPTRERNKIVYSELNFPSVRYFYQTQEELETRVVPCPDGVSVPLDAMLDAIDERTLLVPISHVIFKSSYIQQVEAIIAKAHSVGALVLLDVYQSAGVVPFSARELAADFVIGGSIKWLCGGPGVAFLYVAKELAERLQPRATGWIAHENPFAFEPEMRYSSGAYRFMNGTPNIPAIYAARAGYEIIAEVGVERIREHSKGLTGRILDWADELGYEVNSPQEPDRRGGHVSVNPPRAREISQELVRRGFLVDYRPEAGIRIAPHFYNTEEEVDRLMKEMASL